MGAEAPVRAGLVPAQVKERSLVDVWRADHSANPARLHPEPLPFYRNTSAGTQSGPLRVNALTVHGIETPCEVGLDAICASGGTLGGIEE